jgi:hypothetical protein
MGRPLPKQDHRIGRQDAARLTRRFRGRGRPEKPMPAIAFHRDAFDRILRQPGCVGIRAYPATTESGGDTLVLVGVDAEGNDMVAGELAEFGSTCPPTCPDDNDLNADI